MISRELLLKLYDATRDPNRRSCTQQVKPWPDEMRELHQACKNYLIATADESDNL